MAISNVRFEKEEVLKNKKSVMIKKWDTEIIKKEKKKSTTHD